MAAVIKAVNAKIRSNKVLDYVCSTRMCALSLKRVLWNIPDRRPGRRPNTSGKKEAMEEIRNQLDWPAAIGEKNWTCRC